LDSILFGNIKNQTTPDECTVHALLCLLPRNNRAPEQNPWGPAWLSRLEIAAGAPSPAGINQRLSPTLRCSVTQGLV